MYPSAGDGAYGPSVSSEEISCRSFGDWNGAGSDSVPFVWPDRYGSFYMLLIRFEVKVLEIV